MGKSSYLRFNPASREIELEGSEEFIKTYFEKIQKILPQSAGDVKKEPEATAALPVKKATAKKSKKVSLIDKVVTLIQDSETGMITADLQDKTGMTPKQIWSITSRAVKMGKIKTTKRGVYVPG